MVSTYEEYKSYRQNNLEHCKAWEAMETQCACGTIVRRDYFSVHQKTKLHKKRMLQLDRITTAQGYG